MRMITHSWMLLGVVVWFALLLAPAHVAQAADTQTDITSYWNDDVDYSSTDNVQEQNDNGNNLLNAQLQNPNDPLRFNFDSVTATNLLGTVGASTAPAISNTSVLRFTINSGDTINTSIFGSAKNSFDRFLTMFSVQGKDATGDSWFDLTSPGVSVTVDGSNYTGLDRGAIPITSGGIFDFSSVIKNSGGTLKVQKKIVITVDLSKVKMSDGSSLPSGATSLIVKQQFVNSAYSANNSESWLKLKMGALSFSIPLVPVITNKLALPANANGYFAMITGTITTPGDDLMIGVDANSDGQIDSGTGVTVNIVGDDKWVFVVTDDQAAKWGITKAADGSFSKTIVVKETQPDTSNSGTDSTTITGAGTKDPSIDWQTIIDKIRTLLDQATHADPDDLDDIITDINTQVTQVEQIEEATASGYAITVTQSGDTTPLDFVFAPVDGATDLFGNQPVSTGLVWSLTKDGQTVPRDTAQVTGVQVVPPASDSGVSIIATPDSESNTGTFTVFKMTDATNATVNLEVTYMLNGKTFTLPKTIQVLSLDQSGDQTKKISLNQVPTSLDSAKATWAYQPGLIDSIINSANGDVKDGDNDQWSLNLGTLSHLNNGDQYRLKITLGDETLYSNQVTISGAVDTGFLLPTLPTFAFKDSVTGGDPTLIQVIDRDYDPAGTKSLTATDKLGFGAHFGNGVNWQLSAELSAFTDIHDGHAYMANSAVMNFAFTPDAASQAAAKTSGMAGWRPNGTVTSSSDTMDGYLMAGDGTTNALFAGTSTGDFDMTGDITATMKLLAPRYATSGNYSATLTWSLGTPAAEADTAAR